MIGVKDYNWYNRIITWNIKKPMFVQQKSECLYGKHLNVYITKKSMFKCEEIYEHDTLYNIREY